MFKHWRVDYFFASTNIDDVFLSACFQCAHVACFDKSVTLVCKTLRC